MRKSYSSQTASKVEMPWNLWTAYLCSIIKRCWLIDNDIQKFWVVLIGPQQQTNNLMIYLDRKSTNPSFFRIFIFSYLIKNVSNKMSNDSQPNSVNKSAIEVDKVMTPQWHFFVYSNSNGTLNNHLSVFQWLMDPLSWSCEMCQTPWRLWSGRHRRQRSIRSCCVTGL